MASYMDAGEEQASRNEEMTNHCRSTDAISPTSETAKNSYPCPSIMSIRPGCWHSVHFANSPTGWCPGKKEKMQFGCGNAHGIIFPEPVRLISVNADKIFKKDGVFEGWREHPWRWDVMGGSKGWLFTSLIMGVKVLLTHMLSTVLDEFGHWPWKEFNTGSCKLNKTLCFVTNTLGVVGEKGHKHVWLQLSSPYHQLSQGLV